MNRTPDRNPDSPSSRPLVRHLPDEAATLELGRALGRAALDAPAPLPALMLTGPLGAGKTTLVRGLISVLPGADQAEVASPSFNLVNLYPTRPEVAHFDLYRVDQGAGVGEDAEELLDSGAWTVIEWAERLPAALLPPERLEMRLEPEPGPGSGTGAGPGAGTGPNTGRRAAITAYSPGAGTFLAALARAL